MAKKRSDKRVNKELVVRALTEPRFRRELSKDPASALKVKKLSTTQAHEVKLVLAMVKGIDRQISGLADELLCATGGGGCGIA
ncbi:MAG: hypothetical protein KZQ99_09670 [Candidatus Thiodiazotropha sp. (ex Dulcina madagascariensis)]|nr:hypothetical protein [Candidatus Thiodiazotropha sp. (ex Epidulcina cf. delphinae)]MCU7924095.1 hypothetical protein [Candidatus Thiodiazotropha sp. (ex Dulcina madagascariensis)]MCU7927970.1 hypothetical protein [Candidatus Thiodiazotropha sp. (ex Dulcina madagascariensis)]MCU7935135.1 hypothetical protein [Candidatus Thiodiazotropha sp. (ex Dulcina madagascariensis)]